MRRAWCALLLAGAALSACESSTVSAEKASATEEGHEAEQEEDSDTAPFMIVVEHASGRRCSGSLVSLRTAITTAWCAGGGGGGGGGAASELRALAPGAGAERRVARVLLAAGAAGAAADLAVLELEAPFEGGARSRPILMAAQADECAVGAACHVVRARGGGRAPRLHIVDAALTAGGECAPSLRDTALCVVGAKLCSSDWGAGVVCEGKLCGVLSHSAGAGAGAGVGAGDACGDTHVAQSIPRWRRFLHCAHTLRACGRGGDCEQLCSERRLLDAGGAAPSPSPPAADTAAPPDPTPAVMSMLPTPTHAPSVPRPMRLSSVQTPTRSAPPAPASSPQASPRAAFEFEPNRPDFKVGEYGDNAAEYGGEDAAMATSPKPTESSARPAPPTSPAPPAPSPETHAPPSPERRAGAAHPPTRSRAAPQPAPLVCILYILVSITDLAN